MAFSNRKGRGSKYGGDHQAERRLRLTYVKPGDPCGYCHRPLPRNTRSWHLPHNAAGTGYLPGMWHGTCNLTEAAIRGARKTNATRKAGKVTKLTW